MSDLQQLFPGASRAFRDLNDIPARPVVATRSARRPPVDPVLAAQSEKQFQEQVITTARQRGWHVVHFNDSRRETKNGLVGDSDARGWPDLTLIRDRVLFRELKKVGGKLTVAQLEMLERLKGAGEDAGVWTPLDWPAIAEALA